MKIEKILSQNRRDFHAIYICEGCGTEEIKSGYDDRNFHDNVIPSMVCKNCGKTRIDLGIDSEPTATKYQSWEQV